MWVPGHSGLEDNKRADKAGSETRTRGLELYLPMHDSVYVALMRDWMKGRHIELFTETRQGMGQEFARNGPKSLRAGIMGSITGHYWLLATLIPCLSLGCR